MSGYISDSFGWEWIFYIFGVAAIIWNILWYTIVYRSPENDRWITTSEREFIAESQKELSGKKAVMKPPWKAIFTSLPVWAIVVAQVSYMWGFFTLLTQLPSYLDEVLKFSLNDSAILSSLPYLVYIIIVFGSGFIADWIFKKKFFSVTQIRIYFNNFTLLSQMVLLFIVAFLTDPTPIIICIMLSVGLGAFASCGYTTNSLDIAPQFSSIVSGISCTFATISGMVSPILTGYIATTPVRLEFI